MTVRAVVLPGTPLLVPGAAGAATVLEEEREAALAALGRLVDGVPDDGSVPVVVVAPGTPRPAGPVRGPARASLAAAGVADAWVDPTWAAATRHDDRPVAGVAASVGLLALAGAGWAGPVEVLEVGGQDAAAARMAGAALARRGARVVVMDDPRLAAPAAVLDGLGLPGDDAEARAASPVRAGATSAVRWYDDGPAPSAGSGVSR